MMKVVGEEGTVMQDFVLYLKSEYLDATYLQQNAFDEVDSATPGDRQKYVFGVITGFLRTAMRFKEKDDARRFFHKLTQIHKDWNRIDMKNEKFKPLEDALRAMVAEVANDA